MRLLVLGGTAFLSRAVAEEAVARGHDVVVACRGSSGPVPAGATHVPLDRSAPDAAGVLAGIDGVDVVVDVARTPSWVRTAVAALPQPHWVFVSTVSVYDDVPPAPDGTQPLLAALHEDVDLRTSPPEAYGAMKVACEELVRAGTASSLVLRPGLIVGPGDYSGRFTYWPVRLAEGGDVLVAGRPDDLDQVIDVRDLGAWVVHCAEERLTGTIDAVGPRLRRDDFLVEVLDGVRRVVPDAAPELVWVSDEVLLAHDVRPWMGPRSVPLWLPASEFEGSLVQDPLPALQAGLVCRSVADTAADTLAWAQATPDAGSTGLTRAEEAEVLAAVRA